MYTQVGSCPGCGAPIYAPMVCHSILPPPPIYTCNCFGEQRRTYTTTGTVANVSDQVMSI